MNLITFGGLCRLGFHDWKRTGMNQPVKANNEFSNEAHVMAMGTCCRCGKEELRPCYGTYTWHSYEEMTEAEYKERYQSGELKQKGGDTE